MLKLISVENLPPREHGTTRYIPIGKYHDTMNACSDTNNFARIIQSVDFFRLTYFYEISKLPDKFSKLPEGKLFQVLTKEQNIIIKAYTPLYRMILSEIDMIRENILQKQQAGTAALMLVITDYVKTFYLNVSSNKVPRQIPHDDLSGKGKVINEEVFMYILPRLIQTLNGTYHTIKKKIVIDRSSLEIGNVEREALLITITFKKTKTLLPSFSSP